MTTRDSEGAASGGELSEGEIEHLRYLAAHVLLGSPADFDERTGLLLRLLDEHRERGERIKELRIKLAEQLHANSLAAVRAGDLEQEVALLRDVAGAAAIARSYVEHCEIKHELAVALDALAAHNTKQGQGGESGSKDDGHS